MSPLGRAMRAGTGGRELSESPYAAIKLEWPTRIASLSLKAPKSKYQLASLSRLRKDV